MNTWPLALRTWPFAPPLSRRTAMIGSEVRTLVAPVLRECPPECGMVAITEVSVAERLESITLYISSLKHPDLALTFLQKQSGALRQRLLPLGLRRLPVLHFRLDVRSERGARIEELLRESDDTSENLQGKQL